MIQICDSLKSISGSLDLSSLAKISDGYSAGHIEKSVTTVVTDRRIQQVHKIVERERERERERAHKYTQTHEKERERAVSHTHTHPILISMHKHTQEKESIPAILFIKSDVVCYVATGLV